MKKSSSAKPGNKGKQVNNMKQNAPEMHDSNMRRQPPTPQDIQRVQPVSQNTKKNQADKDTEPKSRRGPK